MDKKFYLLMMLILASCGWMLGRVILFFTGITTIDLLFDGLPPYICGILVGYYILNSHIPKKDVFDLHEN